MRFLVTTAVSALFWATSLAAPQPEPDEAKVPLRCQTVTSTAELCPTCPLKECLAISTISSRPGCPWPVATSVTSYPCSGGGCPTGCATTSYVTKPPCPTVTSLGTVCSTCVRPMCITLKTITCQEGCRIPAPTVTRQYPCGHGCPGGCQTSWVYETPAGGCGHYLPPPTPTPQ